MTTPALPGTPAAATAHHPAATARDMPLPGGPARPASRVRPVPWVKLARVTWRQHRFTLAGAAALLGAVSLYLLIMGLKIRGAYAAVAACHPAGSAQCQRLQDLFNAAYYGRTSGSVMSSGLNAQTVPFLLLALPGLLGVFAGAPLLAREFESGTFRFAWTQGAGRLRPTVTKLVLLAGALTAAAFAVSQLFSWYFHPFFAEGETSAFPMQLFGTRGVAFAAWTLAAFAIGAFAGVLIRRTVAAMAVSLTAWTVLDVATMNSLRQHYQAAATSTGNPPSADAWLLSAWMTGPDGKTLSQQAYFSVMQQAPAAVQNSPDPNAMTAWLAAHHYTQWWAYQPAGRFWHFQLIEGGWLLALSLVLIAGTVLLVRRRSG